MLTQTEKEIYAITLNGKVTQDGLCEALYQKIDSRKKNCVKVMFFRMRQKLKEKGVTYRTEKTGKLKQLYYIVENPIDIDTRKTVWPV